MGKLLTDDKKHVEILTHIRVDKSLPKYRVMAEASKGETDKFNNRNTTPFNDSNEYANSLLKNSDALSYDSLKKFMDERGQNVTDFNIRVSDSINRVMDATTMSGFVVSNNWEGSVNRKKPSLWKVIVNYFKSDKKDKSEEKKERNFDVIKFFTDVHGLIDDESAKKYVDRVSDYIECIGYTEKTGQVALKEKLIKNLVINKLESVLYSKGMYRAITEDVIVRLAQHAPKPLSLDYIENYVRNIPLEAIKNKIEADKLQVFDNYCILHYDPDGESLAKTDKEKAEEVRKKKDPILFGLINGSNKLYFVSDWTDELCTLTWDEMVNIVGNEIVEKGFLKEKID